MTECVDVFPPEVICVRERVQNVGVFVMETNTKNLLISLVWLLKQTLLLYEE